jgi:hypothetical protein
MLTLFARVGMCSVQVDRYVAAVRSKGAILLYQMRYVAARNYRAGDRFRVITFSQCQHEK